MSALTCPRDGAALTSAPDRHALACTACQGEFMVNGQIYQRVVDQFHPVVAFRHLSCPQGQADLKPYHHHLGNLELDCCAACQAIWFDPKEKQRLYRFIENYHKKLHQPVFRSKKRAEALAQTLSVEQQLYAEYQKSTGFRSPTRFDEMLLQIFLGLPIEHNLVPFRRAVMTFLLIAINILIFGLALRDTGAPYFPQLAFYPATDGLVDMVTAMFSHAGMLHLVGNLYFLFVVGDNVEDLMGPFKFLLLYLATGVLGFMYYDVVSAASTLPHLGASGAVCGLMGAYMCFFPRVKFSIRFLIVLEFGVSCFLLFPVYMVWDWIMCLLGDTQVAYEAHIVGFVVGFVLAYFFKKSRLV